MKKIFSISILCMCVILGQSILKNSSANAHEPYTSPHTGYTATQTVVKKQVPQENYVNIVRPVYGAVVSSGVNYIDRDIGTGEIKQVVQVAPPPAYPVGRIYY